MNQVVESFELVMQLIWYIYIYIYFVFRDYGRDLSSFATRERHIDVCCIRSFITLASKQ